MGSQDRNASISHGCKCLIVSSVILYLDSSSCCNVMSGDGRSRNLITLGCSTGNHSYDTHAMEGVISIQGSNVVVDVVGCILDKFLVVAWYICTLEHSCILFESCDLLVRAAVPMCMQ